MNNIDWIKDFQSKFGNDQDLTNLGDRRFYGSVSINFADGKIVNCDIRQHKVYTYNCSSTLTQKVGEGGRDGS